MKKMVLVGLIGMVAVSSLTACMSSKGAALKENKTENVIESVEEIVEVSTEEVAGDEIPTEETTEIMVEGTEAETEADIEAETEPETEEVTEVEVETETQTQATTKPQETTTESSYTFETIVITTRPTTPKKEEPKELTLEEKLLIDQNADKNGSYKYNNVIYNRGLYLKETTAAKNQWIKENFGTSFSHNGIEFRWDEKQKTYYWICVNATLHYMTSTTTSREEYRYRNAYSYRIADYLGFYGTDHSNYHNEDVLYDYVDNIDSHVKYNSIDGIYENNYKYLKELGWEDVESTPELTKDWTLKSPEGVPAYMTEDGYIKIYISYEGKKEQVYTFTIEAYNEFIQNTNWRTRCYKGKRGYAFVSQDQWESFMRMYIEVL